MNRTTGPLQQHLRLNVRAMDSYDTVRDVITSYYKSRHIMNFRTVDTGGPAPMDVGALWRKGGRGKMGPHWKGGEGKEEENGPPLE